VTLEDAAVLIRDLEPFQQARPVWDRAAEMILVAATTGEAIEGAFAGDVDYAMLVKLYGESAEAEKRYSCTRPRGGGGAPSGRRPH
jgi:hypothetical protein